VVEEANEDGRGLLDLFTLQVKKADEEGHGFTLHTLAIDVG
jgi:hypothetical protein